MIKNSRKLLLALIPIVSLLLCCCIILLVISTGGKPKSALYLEQISLAEQFAQNADYEKAILHYEKAIEENAQEERPYIEVAQIYFYQLNDAGSALSILRKGFDITKSVEIDKLIYKFSNPETADKNQGDSLVKLSSNMMNILNSYTYEMYSQYYTIKSERVLAGLYVVEYSQIPAKFTYESDVNLPILMETGKPYSSVRPTYVEYTDLSELVSGISNGVTVNDIKNMGATNVKINDFDKVLNTCTVTFTYNTCEFIIGCDAQGTISDIHAYNKIVLPKINGNHGSRVNGKVVSVTTGQVVKNAKIVFRKGKMARTGDIIEVIETRDGTYNIHMEPGNYTAEVTANGYMKEYFTVFVNNNGSPVEANFSITTAIGTGKIRIVLEWGSNPRDLDSHLVGTASDGTDVHCYYRNRNISSSALGTIAQLDVDKTDGYGPETTTLFDRRGTYRYSIVRFSGSGSISTSGATVKIYTSTGSQPMIVTPPSTAGDNWEVFEIADGQIKNINGSVSQY